MSELIISPRVQLGLKGFLTHQVLDSRGRIVSSFRQENLLTNAGLSTLTDTTISTLLTHAIIGRKTSVSVSDLSTDWWDPVAIALRCDASPEQVREITGDSDQAAITENAYTLDGSQNFIKRTATRDFWFGGDANYGNEFAFGRDVDGVQPPLPSGDLAWEKLAAWGFTDAVQVHTLEEDCGDPTPNEYEEYQLSDGAKAPSTLWCNELFRDGGGSPITYKFGSTGTGDLTIALDGILRLIYELHIYIPKTIVTDIISVDGTSIDCDSRAYRIDQDGWADAGGLAGRLGYWGATGNQHRVWEENAMPNLLSMQSGTSEAADSASELAASGLSKGWEIVVDPGTGNFASGIGSLTWGSVSSAAHNPAFITTFTPKIPKTDIHRIKFSPRLTWARI